MRANILIVVILTLCLGCRRGSDGGVERSETMVSLDLFVGSGSLTRSTSLSDDSFSDLALYIFNEGGELELYHKEDALSQQIMVEIALHLSEGEKEIFIFANYLDKSLYDVSGEPCTLNEDSSLEQLNSLTTCIESDFDPTSLLMVGRAEVEITPQSESISIELRRLSARLDINIFKGEGFDGEDITVESVSFDNQILNSEVVFDYDEATAQMVQPIVLGEQ
ncbi:MAG: FimB/Mfa2 family fimbrial subunit, partial [Rikenellaceae bacterium]